MEHENNPQLPEQGGGAENIPTAQQPVPETDIAKAPNPDLILPENPELEKILEEARSWEPEDLESEISGAMDEEDAAAWDALLNAMPDMEQAEAFPQGEDSDIPEAEAPEADILEDDRLVPPEQELPVRAVFDETRRYDKDSGWTIPEDLLGEEEYCEEPELPEKTEPQRKLDVPIEKKENVKKEIKSRPGLKKGYGFFGLPHLAASLIWLAIIVGIGVSLGHTLWVCAAEVLAFGKPDMSVTITITEEDMAAEDTLQRVAAKLKNAGLIDHPDLFIMYANVTDAKEEIAAGTYTLKGTDDYMALVNSMNTHSGARETVEVMIPEGYTCSQIFALLEEKGVCSAEALGEYAANGDLGEYWFLEGVQRGSRYCLEGYLFPDTYEFYVGDDAGRVLTKMLGDSVGGFNVRFTDIMEDKLVELNQRLSAMMKKNGYNQAYIDEHQLTIRDVVIVASMIEKETTGSDRYDISSVIYNRLTNAGEHPYLNIDATIIYALGGKVDPLTGENIPLTEADMKIDSPYNTYLYKGLPPGPISNPGVYSLLAALDPNETGYYYYVYNPAIGAHKFSSTYKEHQNYINSMG